MNKTIDQILLELNQVKPCCRRQLHRYLKTFNIKPVGANQRPQRYPAETTDQLLQHLGMGWNAREAGILSVKEAKRRAGRGGK